MSDRSRESSESSESSVKILEKRVETCEERDEEDEMSDIVIIGPEMINQEPITNSIKNADISSDPTADASATNIHEREIKRSFARLCRRPNPVAAVPLDRTQLFNSLYLNIPCPKCQEADCFWCCRKCFERLRYKEKIIYCDCSQGNLQEFEFCCVNKKHGNEFFPYEKEKINDVLERLTLKKCVNILLLGLTGVGKTTLINSITNYLSYETLEKAESNELRYLVPISFQFVQNDFQKTDVRLGKENECEVYAIGESATRCPKIHSIVYNNVVLNFIDTPGLCDTAGINRDKEHLNHILSYICSFDELHGICIMLKSNETRKSSELKYCINQLLLHFHKASIKNFIFCFTLSTGNVAHDSVSIVDDLLQKINKENGTNIALSPENTYSLDNEAFRYLCASKNGITYGNEDYCQNAWDRSRNAAFRLINHVLSNTPHLTNETVALNTIRSIIIGLNKPLATITIQIQKNKLNLETQRTEIQNLTGKEKDFQSRLKVSQMYITKRSLNHWRVVCNKCATVKRDDRQNDYKVYSKVCCDRCRAPWLYFCAEISIPAKCKQCRCPLSHHEHINYEYVENKEEVEDKKVKKELTDLTSEIEKRNHALDIIDTYIKEQDKEQEIVNKWAAKFSHYLKSNSIIWYNKSHNDYLEQELHNAISARQTAAVENLQKARDDYFKETKILEEQLKNSNTNSFSNYLTLEDVIAARDELFGLKWNGSTLRNIFDNELTNPLYRHISTIEQNLKRKQSKNSTSTGGERKRSIFTNVTNGALATIGNLAKSITESRYAHDHYKDPLNR